MADNTAIYNDNIDRDNNSTSDMLRNSQRRGAFKHAPVGNLLLAASERLWQPSGSLASAPRSRRLGRWRRPWRHAGGDAASLASAFRPLPPGRLALRSGARRRPACRRRRRRLRLDPPACCWSAAAWRCAARPRLCRRTAGRRNRR